MVKLLKQMYTGVKFSGSSTTVFTWTSSTSLCLWEPWRESPKTVHHHISTCNSPTVFTGFFTTVFTWASSVSLGLREPWGETSKTVHHYISTCDSPIVFIGFSTTAFTCTSLTNYISSSLCHSVHCILHHRVHLHLWWTTSLRHDISIHCILHHCVHLHLFGELHLFITTSQDSLCSPCHWVHHLFRELHRVITVWENLSVLDSLHCCGHLHLFTKLRHFITVWGKSPTTFIFIIKMLVDYTILRGLTKITEKNPFAGFLCLCVHPHFFTELHLFIITWGESPASLCHYMRGVSNSHWFSLPLGSPALLHWTTSLRHYTMSLQHLFVTTWVWWEGSPTVIDSLCLWVHQHFFTELHLFVITKESLQHLFVTTWEGSPTVTDSLCLWVHHLSRKLQHYMRGFSNSAGCNLNHFAHPSVNCMATWEISKFSVWLILFSPCLSASPLCRAVFVGFSACSLCSLFHLHSFHCCCLCSVCITDQASCIFIRTKKWNFER